MAKEVVNSGEIGSGMISSGMFRHRPNFMQRPPVAATMSLIVFMAEKFCDETERGMLLELVDFMIGDKTAVRNAYVDYLLEKGRNDTAELVRSGMFP